MRVVGWDAIRKRVVRVTFQGRAPDGSDGKESACNA